MEKLSKVVERVVSEVVVPNFNERERARNLIAEIAGHCWGGKGDMVDRVFAAIRQQFPRPTWTRRRVRAFWHREQAAVRWQEMRELEFVAEVERAARLQPEEARTAHNEFIVHIDHTLDRLAVSDAEFHETHRAALRDLALGRAHPTIGHASCEGDRGDALGGKDNGR